MIGDINIVADPDVTWDNYAATAARCRAAGYDGVLTPDEFARVTDFMARGLNPNQALELMMNDKTESNTESQQAGSSPEPSELPLYKCHKLVRAAEIAGVEFDTEPTEHLSLMFLDMHSPSGVVVDTDWLLTRVRPDLGEGMERADAIKAAAEKAVGGYYVVYDDGHTSWSPGRAFENGYVPYVEPPAPEPITAVVAEATLSERPFDFTDLAMTVIENGHIAGGTHAGIVLERVIDTADPAEQMSYALFAMGNPMPLTYMDVQSGPVADAGPNGFTLENLLAVVIDRLELFQASDFKCQENKMAIHYARQALGELTARTRRRIARGVEGTHEV